MSQLPQKNVYLKRQGRALSDDAVELDEEDKVDEVEIDEMSDMEDNIVQNLPVVLVNLVYQ